MVLTQSPRDALRPTLTAMAERALLRAGSGAAKRRKLRGASHVCASNEENESGRSSVGHCKCPLGARTAAAKLKEKLERSLVAPLVLLFIIPMPSV
jgi:hypothetical protein